MRAHSVGSIRFALLLPVLLAMATPASAATIAFVSDRDEGSDIYVIGADGGGLRRLTAPPTYAYTVAWSPDGARIAFTADTPYPEFSGGGAFASLDDENADIYAMNADGTGVQRITTFTGDIERHYCDDQLDPAWSPDGKRIAFATNHTGNFEIYVMNANGSGWQRLTRSRAEDRAPAWSPDGKRIVWAKGLPGGEPRFSAPGGHSEVWVMSADGSGGRRLARNPRGNETSFGCANPSVLPGPEWSPDGRRIAFERFRGYARPKIYVVNADGSGRKRLTAGYDTDPAWSPDGWMIAFTRYARGNSDLYVMNANGSGVRRLTRNRAEDRLPAWRPDPGAPR